MIEQSYTVTQEFTKPGHATYQCNCGEWELEETAVHDGYMTAIGHIRAAHQGNGGVHSDREAF